MHAGIMAVKQDSIARYTAIIKDERDNVIPGSTFSSFTLTLYNDSEAEEIINSRDEQNVLNANNVTIDESGNFAWTIQPADNKIFDSSLDFEDHIALFKFEWESGAKRSSHKVVVRVERIDNVSSSSSSSSSSTSTP